MNVGLSLGSNLGDRLAHLQAAKLFLLGLTSESRQSPVYETEPVGCPPKSPQFLNAVLEIDFAGTPRTLLEHLHTHEATHGRDWSLPKNAARTIDLDILYFGEEQIAESGLIIPHPRLAMRRFVLEPLATIRPDLIIPGAGRTVAQLLQELPAGVETVTFIQREW